ncbi:pentapeptide repeat-containing protein [Aliinostoc sp. HNIBRCY26]|uniref:pentapeptide repeat-containing protein n=1 Tax=Aliinostoc sp. HNIBRCY26 TaxID=3418997 RepID=UPI003D03C915
MIQPAISFFVTLWSWIGDSSKQFSAIGSILTPLAILSGSVLIQWLVAKQNRKTSEGIANRDREAARNRYLQEIIFNYIDRMTTLIIDKGLSEEIGRTTDDLGDAWVVARSLTIAVFQEPDLGADRVRLLTSFLGSANLIGVVGAGSKSLLTHANLSNTNLMYAQFGVAFLNFINLTNSNLSFADFTGAFLYRADLSGADLTSAQFLLSRLESSNLENAILKNANLEKADLRGSNLSRAILEGAVLKDSLYNTQPINSCINQATSFPDGFEPEKNGMKLLNDDSYPYSLTGRS